MYCDGEINKYLAIDALKIMERVKNGLARELIAYQLRKIKQGCYDGYYTNDRSVDVFDGDSSKIDLLIYRDDDFRSNEVFTHPYDMFLIPIKGEILADRYELSDSGEILDKVNIEIKEKVNFFSKTTKSNRLYDFYSRSGDALCVLGYSKYDNDDVLACYSKESFTLKSLISSNSTESRIEFWLSNYPNIRIPDLKIEKIMGEAKSRKFKAYLDSL